MTDIQTWLDKGKMLADKATQGPWEARSSEATMNDRSEWKIGKYNRPQVLRSVMRGDDTVFIADARTRLPRALAALQAVLDLHHDNGDGLCNECSDEFLANDPRPTVASHPCTTVQAIQNALGQDA